MTLSNISNVIKLNPARTVMTSDRSNI